MAVRISPSTSGFYETGREAPAIKEFRDFLMRGNLLELAVAFVMGLAFATVITSLVDNLVMPIVAIAAAVFFFVVVKPVGSIMARMKKPEEEAVSDEGDAIRSCSPRCAA